MRYFKVLVLALGLGSMAYGFVNPCEISTSACSDGVAKCTATSYTPFPLGPDSTILRWANGTCTQGDKAVVCDQKNYQGTQFGPATLTAETTTYACCDHSDKALVTKDKSEADASCERR